jgi:hypothetical protein
MLGPPAGVMRCPASGCGGNPTVFSSGQNYPLWVAVDEATVYWTDAGDYQKPDGAIMKCPIAGCAGAPTMLVPGLNAPDDIVVDAAHLYWTEPNWTYPTPASVVRQSNKDGSNVIVLATNQEDPWELVVDGTSVYWTNYVASGTVVKCAIGGCNGTPTVLASGQGGPLGIAIDETSLYWATELGTVMKMTPK